MAWLHHQAKKGRDLRKNNGYSRRKAFKIEEEVFEGYWTLVLRNRTILEVVEWKLLNPGLPRYTRLRKNHARFRGSEPTQ